MCKVSLSIALNIAHRNGFIAFEEIEKIKAKYKELSVEEDEIGLPDFLLRNGMISQNDTTKLRNLLRPVDLICTNLRCNKKYPVVGYEPETKYSCENCKSPLILSMEKKATPFLMPACLKTNWNEPTDIFSGHSG